MCVSVSESDPIPPSRHPRTAQRLHIDQTKRKRERERGRLDGRAVRRETKANDPLPLISRPKVLSLLQESGKHALYRQTHIHTHMVRSGNASVCGSGTVNVSNKRGARK